MIKNTLYLQSNKGFSNILVISFVLILLVVGGYFGFKYFQSTDNKLAPVKKEITKFKPTISDIGEYYELVDSNSINKISIKLPKSIVFDTSYYYGEAVNKDIKKVNEIEKYEFETYEGDNRIYNLIYTPKLIVPIIDAKFGGCLGDSVHIASYSQSAKSLLNQQEKTSDLTELNLSSFNAYSLKNMPDAGNGHTKTLVQVDENYTIEISSPCIGSIKDGDNDAVIDLYNQIVNSVSEIK